MFLSISYIFVQILITLWFRQGKDPQKPRREKLALPKAEPAEDSRAKKKPRISKDSAPEADMATKESEGSKLGSVIGRKRKERKMKKGSR